MSEKEVEHWREPETTIYRGIACGGTGGDPVAIDSKDGKLIRFRPTRWDTNYTVEELKDSWWDIEVDGKKFTPDLKGTPNYFALAYKNRVYSKNRVKYPLKRIDWEPGGDPAKINAQNRGKSKFVRISWDEALDILTSEIQRTIDTYGPFSVLCIGEDGHKESKNIHAGGSMIATVMNELGGYTREARTPDSVEGWYWGAKHFWGSGSNRGLGMIAPVETNYSSWNVAYDITLHSELIAFHAGDLELTQNYASQFWSRLINYWKELGKEFVIIDPFCNYTAICHDTMKWIPILPNTDAALDFAIMYVWIKEGLYQKDYIDSHSLHFDKLEAYILGKDDGIEKTPAWAAPLCGVPEWTIKALARKWGKKVTGLVHFSSGSIKGPYSHEPGRTHAYKLAMQGLGRPGVQQMFMNASDMSKHLISPSTTYPFHMGQKCRQFYPTVQSLPRTGVADAIKTGTVKWWGSPCIVYVDTAEQFVEFNYPAPKDKGGTECHLLWSEKPCNMGCWNGGFNYQEALRSDKVELFVTNHQWLENDSLFADIVLPVTTCVEEDDIVGASQIVPLKHAAIQDRAVDPVGESLSDYQIALAVAKRFGVDENISLGMDIEEWRQYNHEHSRVIEEISYEDLKKKGYYIPKIDPDWKNLPPGMRNFYEDPDTYPLDTPSGKLEFWSQALADNFPDDKERQPLARWMIGGPAEEGWTHDETPFGEKAKTYPLLLTANPARFRVHVQGDDIAWFREIETVKVKGPDGYGYEPLWIAPEDAEARGIKHGDIVKVHNDQGIILTGAYVTERVAPGSVVIAKGSRVDPIASGIDRGGSTNLISPPRPISKHCWGFAVTGYLVEATKLEQEEYDEWKQKYPEAFARDYDPSIGINYNSWVEGGE
jgi:trimethylamine-N-oxide reductase (cytochrome c)